MQNANEIKEQIVFWHEKIAQLESDLQAAKERAEQAKAERDKHLLAARGEQDPKAKKALEKARKALLNAAQEEEELELALAQARDRVKSLQTDLAAAERLEKQQELAKLAGHRLELARAIEEQAGKLYETIDRHTQLSKQMYAIKSSLDGPTTARHLLAQRRLFGYFCYKFVELFPADLPRPLPVDRRPFLEAEREVVEPIAKISMEVDNNG